ncbi:hypothetical protein [Comamonas testosteroni]|uniref:hypothetical protein n=1 Tax=Comamonas testosteroni TaxID=285 RepID=UPI00391AF32D
MSLENKPAATHTDNQARGESVSSKLRDYALENPAKTLSMCVLTFGGILMLIYFFRIEFLPDINLESATTLLYAVAVLGLFIVLMLAAYLIMPALVAKAIWHDYQQQGSLTDGWALGLSGGAAFLSVIATMGLAIWDKADPGASFLICIFFAASTAFVIALIKGGYECPLNSPKPNHETSGPAKSEGEKKSKWEWNPLNAAFMVFVTAVVQWFILLTVVLITIGLGRDGALRGEGAAAYSIVAAQLLISASVPLLFQKKMEWGRAIRLMAVVGLALLLGLLLITQSVSKPSAIVVGHLGAGEIEATRLVLSGKGCKQLNLALGEMHCAEVKDDEPTVLCPVALRSRIGAQILVEVAPMELDPEKSSGKADSGEGKKDNSGDNNLKKRQLVWRDYKKSPQGTVPRKRVILDKSTLLAWSTLSSVGVYADKVVPANPAPPASLVYLEATSKDKSTSNELDKALLKLCGEKQPVTQTPAPPTPAPKPRPPKPLPQPPKPVACCCTAAPVSADSRSCQDATPLSPKVSTEPAHVES